MKWRHETYWRDDVHELRCTARSLSTQYDDDEIGTHVVGAECDEPMFVTWTLCVDPSFAVADAKEAGDAAFGSVWKLECAAGHVVAISHDENGDAVAYVPHLVGVPPEPDVAAP